MKTLKDVQEMGYTLEASKPIWSLEDGFTNPDTLKPLEFMVKDLGKFEGEGAWVVAAYEDWLENQSSDCVMEDCENEREESAALCFDCAATSSNYF